MMFCGRRVSSCSICLSEKVSELRLDTHMKSEVGTMRYQMPLWHRASKQGGKQARAA